MPALVVAFNFLYLGVPSPEATTVRVGEFWKQYWQTDPKRLGQVIVDVVAHGQPLDLLICPQRGGWGCRFLTVDHRTLVGRVWGEQAIVELRSDNTANAEAMSAVEGVFLRGRNLRFAKLDESRLYAANLRGADLRQAILTSASLRGANAAGALLQGADLSDAQLVVGNFQRAQLQGAHLRNAGMQDADLHYAVLSAADLAGSHLARANLRGAELQGANLHCAHLRAADLRDANLEGADLRGAQLQGAYLGRARLSQAQFDTGTDLSYTDLREVDFDTAASGDERRHISAGPEKADAPRLECVPRDSPLPHGPVDAKIGSILVDPAKLNGPAAAPYASIRRIYLTTDEAEFQVKLVTFLADIVAVDGADASEGVARCRVFVLSNAAQEADRKFRQDLACRLLANKESKKLDLRPALQKRLRDAAAGACDTPAALADQ
jgi:uncharacterized protein YjbI with pentapeptide repeats